MSEMGNMAEWLSAAYSAQKAMETMADMLGTYRKALIENNLPGDLADVLVQDMQRSLMLSVATASKAAKDE